MNQTQGWEAEPEAVPDWCRVPVAKGKTVKEKWEKEKEAEQSNLPSPSRPLIWFALHGAPGSWVNSWSFPSTLSIKTPPLLSVGKQPKLKQSTFRFEWPMLLYL